MPTIELMSIKMLRSRVALPTSFCFAFELLVRIDFSAAFPLLCRTVHIITLFTRADMTVLLFGRSILSAAMRPIY